MSFSPTGGLADTSLESYALTCLSANGAHCTSYGGGEDRAGWRSASASFHAPATAGKSATGTLSFMDGPLGSFKYEGAILSSHLSRRLMPMLGGAWMSLPSLESLKSRCAWDELQLCAVEHRRGMPPCADEGGS